MSSLGDSGRTRLSLPSLDTPVAQGDRVLQAVREAAAGDYEVFGEMGRSSDGTVAYLARDLTSKKLVALKLAPVRGRKHEYLLDVVSQLNSSLPSAESHCPRCGWVLRRWGRYCTECGGDVWAQPSDGEGWSDDDLLGAVQESTEGSFAILGEMSNAEGGGRIYFAQEIASGRLVALRLQHVGGDEYSVGLTRVLSSVADAVLSNDSAPTVPSRPPHGRRPPAAPPPHRPPIHSPPPPAASRSRQLGDFWARVLELLQEPLILAVVIVAVILGAAAVLIAVLD